MSSQIDRVVTELRGRILAGDIPAGHRVVELQFAETLNVSRTPLRIALGELEKEGLLERLPTRGFRVRQFTVDEIANAVDVRGVLEGITGPGGRDGYLHIDDARELLRLVAGIVAPGSVDLILTSPPYMTVNDHDADPLTAYELEGGDYERYLAELGLVAAQCARLVAPGVPGLRVTSGTKPMKVIRSTMSLTWAPSVIGGSTPS